MPQMIHEGGCLCGALRYRVAGDPRRTTICHCTDCQRRTGTAFALLASAQTATDGKAVFEAQNCNMCHNVPTAQIVRTTKSDKMAGPDLMTAMDMDQLVKFMKKEAKGSDDKLHSKEWKGTDEELTAVCDWLLQNKKPA